MDATERQRRRLEILSRIVYRRSATTVVVKRKEEAEAAVFFAWTDQEGSDIRYECMLKVLDHRVSTIEMSLVLDMADSLYRFAVGQVPQSGSATKKSGKKKTTAKKAVTKKATTKKEDAEPL